MKCDPHLAEFTSASACWLLRPPGNSNFPMLVLPSGKRLQFAHLKLAIEIVDLPMKNGDVP